jgi:dienelactone hydrolase
MQPKVSESSLSQSYRDFIRIQARAASSGSFPPSTRQGWDERLAAITRALTRSFGRVPDVTCELEPEILGTLERDGYAIERLTFQSRPGVRVTANLYRPSVANGRLPGVLSVHGHWAWARMDPHVQPRCIGLAKLGYVVLSVDAFGAGERAIRPAAGTYHGALVGGSLWLLGTPLIGLQRYDNRRAIDYLVSRKEVDPGKLAITGASGGGNQTLYAGAMDDRLTAVIPVCGVGTYDAYLSTACCVCEVNPGGARYATTADLLAMMAPRAVLVISATKDAVQFSVGEAAKSIDAAGSRFRLLGCEDKLRHVSVNSGHDYNQAMREAMYGWVERWLKGHGDGSPVPEPPITIEDVEALKCYPAAGSRPRAVVTIPEFAQLEWQARQKLLPPAPDHAERWRADAERMREMLRRRILGPFPAGVPYEPRSRKVNDGLELSIVTETGIRSRGEVRANAETVGTVIFLTAPGGPPGGLKGDRLAALRQTWLGRKFATLELAEPRGTGRWLEGTSPVVGVADHTVAEWGVWVDRPLLGQWVWDVIRWVDFLNETWAAGGFERLGLPVLGAPYRLFAEGTMSIPAILTAALDRRVSSVQVSQCLVTYVGRSDGAWSGVPMGLFAPNILEVGDSDRLSALVAPRPLSIASGVEPEGETVSKARLESAFAFTRNVYGLLGRSEWFGLGSEQDSLQAP